VTLVIRYLCGISYDLIMFRYYDLLSLPYCTLQYITWLVHCQVLKNLNLKGRIKDVTCEQGSPQAAHIARRSRKKI